MDVSSRNLYAVDPITDSIIVASLDLPNVTSTLYTENIYSAWQLVKDDSGRYVVYCTE